MPQTHSGSGRQNFLATAVLGLSCGLLYASFDPLPAGESPERAATAEPPAIEVAAPAPVMKPASVGAESTDVTSETRDCSSRNTLTNREMIEYCLLLLQDGMRLFKSVDAYTARFHKRERIDGDLSEMQTIDLKVRHSGQFAVYMKWRNGDRGRQLLYSKEYKDGDMVVKLGGLKGRLLPGIRLNPNGSKARSESRHSVTSAGILGMIEKMVMYRERDLLNDHAVRCTRLRNQIVDGHDCCCFLFEFSDSEYCADYRKSLICIDAVRHIPLMAQNHTWATDSEGMCEAELDQLTLIEYYAFTNVDFSKELLAIDFSRDNPKYRM